MLFSILLAAGLAQKDGKTPTRRQVDEFPSAPVEPVKRDNSVGDDLLNICGDSRYVKRWTNVPERDWYWGNDWDERIKLGIDKDGNSGLVYPAGFQPFILPWYSEPPVCGWVPNSRNKKVEILLESELENANMCIHDASDFGVGTNDVGNIDNCGTGKLYACFTAATTTNNANFGYVVYCESGCEETDIAVWMRIRVSDQDWDAGKTNTTDDLEHWCEHERGTHYNNDEDQPLMYTYPSDLIPDEPSVYPFHILHLDERTFASMSRPSVLLTVLLTVVGIFAWNA